MILYVARATVRPGNARAFETLMARVRDLTCANEPGVLHYAFGRSADVPGRYVVVETYRDAAAHAAHMATAWVCDALPRARSLIDGAFDIERYELPDVGAAAIGGSGAA